MRPVDESVGRIAAKYDLRYRRFVDDFTLSGDNPREAIGEVIAVLRAAGFAVGRGKTGNAGAHTTHIVTGYSATQHGLKVTRKKQQEIRTRVYQTILAHQRREPVELRTRSVRGSLAYLRPTNPGLVARLERQLTAAGIALC